jgi:hypothetical protein
MFRMGRELYIARLAAGDDHDRAFQILAENIGLEVARAVQQRVMQDLGEVGQGGAVRGLLDPRHVVWYPGPRPTDIYWPAYRNYVQSVKNWPPELIRSLDAASTRIVSRLQPPSGRQVNTRGLVVGYVQSGKTANYTAVIAKAADVNYKLIVVLAGIHDSLRNQTQGRLQTELRNGITERWNVVTDAERDFGDVPPGLVEPMLTRINQTRGLCVIKKNPFIIERLCNWLAGASEHLRRECPVLVIDDEADQAGINYSDDQRARTRINGDIRRLLEIMPRSAYIGYTATPFANVLIRPEDSGDLYPHDFILGLPRPAGYFGAERIFGRDRLSPEERDEDLDGLDLVRTIPDAEVRCVQPRSRNDRATFQPTIPPSLDEAIRYFWLATAARLARSGSIDFSTMLVHTTLYTEPHEKLRAITERFCDTVASLLEASDPAECSRMRQIWEHETGRVDPACCGANLATVPFEPLLSYLPAAVRRCRVIMDNSRSDHRLDFSEAARGSIYIVIGGNTLSRGLTLEGLVVSYFVRTAAAYDTLLQMGRWFGFRPKYEDLPRVWMTSRLRDDFFDLATVEEEIRQEIERYGMGYTPLDFGPRIRTHPRLTVTSRLKMQGAITWQVSYAGRRVQTILFSHRDPAWLGTNVTATRQLIGRCRKLAGANRSSGGRTTYLSLPVQHVLEFFGRYLFHPNSRELSRDLVTRFIEAENQRNRLLLWNVVVMGQESPGDLGYIDLGTGVPVGMIRRTRIEYGDPDAYANIKALMSKVDIVADLEHGRPASELQRMGPEELFGLRQTPNAALLIYPISRYSRATGGERRNLDAVDDVIGVAMICPPDPLNQGTYITVDMSGVTPVEVEDIGVAEPVVAADLGRLTSI